jgi:hypothetical protein
MGTRNRTLVTQSWAALDRLKTEVAAELGIPEYVTMGYKGDVPSRINGKIGGNMVRRIVQAYEQSVAQQLQTPQA